MVVAKRAGLAVVLLSVAAVAACGARAQTVGPEPSEAPQGAPILVVPPGVAAPAPVIEYAPAPAAPAPPAIEYAPAPLEPAPLTPQPLPPGSATDAGRLDTPKETLGKAGEVVEDLSKGNIKALRRGPLLIHGNYCGVGNKPGLPPVDALDAACMRHDACTETGALPNCACNERLRREATAIATDPSLSDQLRTLAGATAASMAVLICK